MINLQAPERRILDSQAIEVHSLFNTIQGEGPFAGTPAVFIRLAGCNLQCPACDTEYTSTRSRLQVGLIIKEVQQYKSKGLVVITGGEPFRQPIGHLIRSLIASGFYVQVETNGTLPPASVALYNKDTQARYGGYIVVSPKGSKVNPDIERLACAYKYVMDSTSVDDKDGLPNKVLGHPCRTHVARPPGGIPVYLQPADHQDDRRNNENLRVCIRSCMAYGYILQLQIHKIINLP